MVCVVYILVFTQTLALFRLVLFECYYVTCLVEKFTFLSHWCGLCY